MRSMQLKLNIILKEKKTPSCDWGNKNSSLCHISFIQRHGMVENNVFNLANVNVVLFRLKSATTNVLAEITNLNDPNEGTRSKWMF